jgi:S-adenosylmethionine:tRNA ribosyltransferase-isomerase
MNALAFELPPALEATAPPEARGLARDRVRLLVADGVSGGLAHRTFAELPELLAPGDLLVINVSATLPAALPARRAGGEALRVHVSTRAPRLEDSYRVVELRSADGSRPQRGVVGEVLSLPGGAALELVAPYAAGARLLLARFRGEGTVEHALARDGGPIRYRYAGRSWPLTAYQNAYATVPGSAEMPSAGRPFTPELITGLAARGVTIAPITLHCGVSSPERHEPPFPEQYRVPAATAHLLAATRRWGGRVIAVGTTVVRALETAATEAGGIGPATGWTSLVISPERPPRLVDGLITGWHEPQASHLQMLEALAGHELIARSYDAALEHRYLWHEFGDSHLILAPRWRSGGVSEAARG